MSIFKCLMETPMRTLSGVLALLLIADAAFDLWSSEYEQAVQALFFGVFNGYIALVFLKPKPVSDGKLG